MIIPKKILNELIVAMVLVISAISADAQRARGELRIEVRDIHGTPVVASFELISKVNQIQVVSAVGTEGRYVVQDLPFGLYRLTLRARGFAAWAGTVEVRSEVPVHLSATMGVAPVTTQVEVRDAATLVDPGRIGTEYTIGRQPIDEYLAVQPGRSLSDLVDDLPGWLYEANGVLHPRGSEYDVQYVVDGLPITENRSPAFSPAFDADDVGSMRVLTANFPAEYGRKLGGIVEVVTDRNIPAGFHGDLDLDGGSFGAVGSSSTLHYSRGRSNLSASGYGFHTDRYLDPPVLANYTNRGTGGGFSTSYERDLSDRDRLRVSVTDSAVHFQVPNELIQEQAGQRQDATNTESSGQLYFEHIISPDLLLSLAGSVRDAAATLNSNEFATPVIVSQDRGYREGYIRGDVAGHHGRHDWKMGLDSIFNPVHESLQYTITDPTQFDPGTQSPFRFMDRRWDVEPSAYAQDQIHLDNWNVSAGLRFDRYGFVEHDSAWSPRIGVSRSIPSLNLLIHASYDRVFQPPAIENLLLASSPQLDSLDPVVVRLPVEAARGNYYELGITKAFRSTLRLDANVFRRDFHNYSDDDVLLDTGVSFPIAFAKARIIGEELRLAVLNWGRFSGYVSYANQSGIGQGPITGGLFLGSTAASDLTDSSRFAVSQDQRNTASARIRLQAQRRLWFAVDGRYGSGLPADTDNEDPTLLLGQYGAAILDHVNLGRGRVGPNFSVDAASGVEFYCKEKRSGALEIRGANLSDRVNVINFASLFSGTAVAPPRSVSARLRLTF